MTGFTGQQRMMLEAMGLRLYARLPAAAPEAPAPEASAPEASAPVQGNDAFWQSRLGQNIRRAAQGRDLTALPIPASGGTLAKRMLWQQLRSLLKAQ